MNRNIEDLDKKAQCELGDLTDRTIVNVYVTIRTVIADLAKLDCLLVDRVPQSGSAKKLGCLLVDRVPQSGWKA